MIPAGQSITLRCQFCQTWNRIDGGRTGDRPKCGNCAKFVLLDRPWILYEDSFDRTIAETELAVLVDFYADWCGPCKVMAPVIDQVAANFTGRALVAKLNTDLAQKTSAGFNIRGIPTVIVFKGGREVERFSGVLPLAVMEQMLIGAMADVAP